MEERVRTRDIRRTLEEYAQQLGVPVDELDFEVVHAELVGPEDDRFYLEAEIEISLKVPGIISIFDCLVEIEDRAKDSKALIKVLPTFRMQLSAEQLEGIGDRIPLTPTQREELYRETVKLMLKEGVIYGHLSADEIGASWERALASVYGLKRPYSFVGAKGKPPRDPYRREIYHIPLVTLAGRVINQRTGRIDFKDRGYTDKKASAGAKLVTVEYIPGELGIRVTGEVIPYKELPPLPFKVDEETIEVRKRVVEGKEIYELVAKKDGYLYVEDEVIGLSEFVKEKRVDYTTGNIEFKGTGVDIEVAVEGDKAIHYAIRDDFKLISPGKTVVVKGNVGRKAVVEGRFVVIEGMVAKDALVKGEVCKVQSLTGGRIEAQRCFVERAVSASVEADDAFIHTLSGTTVRARRIVALKTLRSSTLYAQDFICVEDAEDFNRLIINPLEVPSVAEELEKMVAERTEKQKKVKVLKGVIEKINGRIKGQLNLLVSYLRPTMRDKAVKFGQLVMSLLDKPEKLEEVMEKMPPYVKQVVQEVMKLHGTRREREGECASLEDRISEINEGIDRIKNRPGVVLVLHSMSQDNMVVIGKCKQYFAGELKGPVLFYVEGEKLQQERDWEPMVERIRNYVDDAYLVLFRDYLLEKGLRTYVTSMKL